MDRTSTAAPTGSILYCALELSKNTWLLGIQFPDRSQPSLYPIRGGNTEDLMAKLTAARDRCAKLSGRAPLDCTLLRSRLRRVLAGAIFEGTRH
jgi:hypothetical protein